MRVAWCLSVCHCACARLLQAQKKIASLTDSSAMLEQQVESLKGMVSSSESQQQAHAKAQMEKITALQEQVNSWKASSGEAQEECTSLKSQLEEATDKKQEVRACL